jgi:hypothetical protein
MVGLSHGERSAAVRQKRLAAHIGLVCLATAAVRPLGRHGSFVANAVEKIQFHLMAERSLGEIVWQTVGRQMQAISKGAAIEHAWMLGDQFFPHEPLAVVSEPLVESARAEAWAHVFRDAMGQWGIRFTVLAPEFGAWNPSGGVSIVAHLDPSDKGLIVSFERLARAALESLLRKPGGKARV